MATPRTRIPSPRGSPETQRWTLTSQCTICTMREVELPSALASLLRRTSACLLTCGYRPVQRCVPPTTSARGHTRMVASCHICDSCEHRTHAHRCEYVSRQETCHGHGLEVCNIGSGGGRTHPTRRTRPCVQLPACQYACREAFAGSADGVKAHGRGSLRARKRMVECNVPCVCAVHSTVRFAVW